jgi:hypothetical protein
MGRENADNFEPLQLEFEKKRRFVVLLRHEILSHDFEDPFEQF